MIKKVLSKLKKENQYTISQINDCLDGDYEKINNDYIMAEADLLIGELESFRETLNYFTKEFSEKTIYLNEQGRFAVDDFNYYTCGCPMELYHEGEWQFGHVEAKDGVYYFDSLTSDNVDLKEGMLVRIRQ